MRILVRSSDEIIRRPHKSLRTTPGAVLQHHLETTGTPEALDGRRGNGQHARILDHRQACSEVRQYRVRRDSRNFVVVKRGQAAKNRSGIGGYRRCCRIEAREGSNVFNTARIQDDVGRLLHNLLSPRKRRSRRELNDIDQVSLILFRNETRWRSRELQPGNTDQRDVDHENNSHSCHQTACQISISVRQTLEAPIKPAKTRTEKSTHQAMRRSTLRIVVFEQHRAKSRAQGQRDKARDDGRCCDRDGKLPKEKSGYSREKSGRNENGAQRERDRDQRSTDFVHCLVSGIRRRDTLAHVALDVFDNNDRVVDDDANRENQAKKGQVVQRYPEWIQNRERPYKGDWNCNHGDN